MAALLSRIANTKLGTLLKWLLRLFIFLIVLLTIGFVWFVVWPVTGLPELEKVDKVIYLQQNWGEGQNTPERHTYYYTGQGTSIPQGAVEGAIRYQWLVNLKLPFSDQRFASPENMRRHRFIVDAEPSPQNPDHLPIGFTKSYKKALGEYVVDVSCAACHSGEIHYKQGQENYAIRIDGGQAMHAFTDLKRGQFGPSLLASLIYTWANPFKFDEFAENVLVNYPSGKDKLSDQLFTSIKAIIETGQNNPLRHLYPVEEGYGRTDALGRIGNTVFGDHLSEENYQVAGAPVSYPYLWNIWKFDWVQYNGSVAQPLARNIGEALGVGATIKLVNDLGEPIPEAQRFSSSVNIKNLVTIESTLQKLTPPQWPAQLFGQVDQAKAAFGKQLFEQHCQGCHGPHVASEAEKNAGAPLKPSAAMQWKIEVVPLEKIGTDGAAANGFMDRKYNLEKTGLKAEDIQQTFDPLFVRQLAREVKSLLITVINAREDKSLPVGRLPDILAAYPDPNISAQASLPIESFNQLSFEFAHLNISLDAKFNLTNKPINDWQCELNCLTQLLLWELKFGDLANKKLVRSWDVKALTEGEGLNLVGLLIKERFYKEQQLTYQQQQCIEGFATLDLPQQVRGYKPRPLEGVWATPPFLHNGSVPNIYEMLLPAAQRTQSFYVGLRQYDPIKLGYNIDLANFSGEKGFLLDTTQQGNRNIGHEFSASQQAWEKYLANPEKNKLKAGVIGPELTEKQRFALIEYLKIHQDLPKTPAGFEPEACSI
ncbi:di-heme-cytochrome C peroxidase [Aliikangiella sp. IMCC44632]